LLSSEDGPADVIARFRALLGHSLAGKLMDCFSCLSLWIAAPLAFLFSRRPLDWILTWLALSGAACLVQRLGQEPVLFQPGKEGDINDVLRTETISDPERFIAGDNPHRQTKGD
jgi:hypothetical protein